MTRSHSFFTLGTALLAFAAAAQASTYGDNLLGVGPSARSLAGNGSAAPQDALAALTGNPAGLDGLPAGGAELDVAATFFLPHVTAQVGALTASSASKTYLIPGLAYVVPRPGKEEPWSFGVGAVGVSGLGVDYRRTSLDTTLAASPYPLVAGSYTQLQILDVVPAAAYRISPDWSVGLAGHADYGRLNLGSGTKHGFGYGVQPGVTFRASEHVSLSFSYVSSLGINYPGVTDFDGNGTADSLKLAAPEQYRFGLAYHPVPELLLVSDVQRVNWGGATGYKDFGWQNQTVWGAGLQYQAIPGRLTVRAGYSYGGNPVKEHNGFDGTGSPANVTNVQGKWINNYYYETFRLIGFPAIVEQHLGLGLSYRLTPASSLDFGYTRAFRKTVSEQGKNLLGTSVTLSSGLSEDSFELGWVQHF